MAFKWYGKVYMDAVFHAYNKVYWGVEGADNFEQALNKDGMSLIYLDHDYDYYDLSKFIEKHGLDLDAIKAEMKANGHEYGVD